LSTAVQYDLVALLEASGARSRGPRRYDCPECGSRRTVAVDEGRGLFHCHHAGCSFSGSIGTLRKRLGLGRGWLSRREYIRLRREREQVSEAAVRLYAAVKARWGELIDRLHGLNRLGVQAHDAGATEATIGALAVVYAERPRILAELLILVG
jgi:ribosomal protein L37AE/L43A